MTDSTQPIWPEQGPFFVRSLDWAMWHRQGFSGYTCDIDDAGVFDHAEASRYHDTSPHPRDVAVPVSDYAQSLNRRIRELERRRQHLTDLVARTTRRAPLAPRGYGE